MTREQFTKYINELSEEIKELGYVTDEASMIYADYITNEFSIIDEEMVEYPDVHEALENLINATSEVNLLNL